VNAHTPGPWIIVVPPSGCDEIRSDNETFDLICEFPFGITKGNMDEANARLIAAAPDLLAAAQLALMDHEQEGIELNHDTVTALRAALAKVQS
jgi:hypothetical protein